ncbi:MAG: flagellar basal body-associated FliL family protein [Bacteroidetes bacterium]|nr:flagellar basal body-associated FliL family protein [Bacteroidota bacterium]
MAKETTPTQAPVQEAPAKDSFSLKKILIIGIPIILIQSVLLYFIFAKFVAPSASSAKPVEIKEEVKSEASPAQVIVVKDIIVNPAGTNGTRFLLTTIGLEVPTIEVKGELEQKEIQTRDVLNTILTNKNLEELSSPMFKESLRKEITDKINTMLRSGKISNVYFSKFIIQ